MIAKLIGKIVKREAVYTKLMEIARRDPDEHILSPDGQEVYMYRFWLFNRITNYKRKYWYIPFSMRIHIIMTPDNDRHMHDHPFNARTWIMLGGYEEVRRELLDYGDQQMKHEMLNALGCTYYDADPDYIGVKYTRKPGDTSTLGYERYHKIVSVSDIGAWTLFAFGPYKGPWGFMVNGLKVLRRQYEEHYKR